MAYVWCKYWFTAQCLQEIERKNNISEEFLKGSTNYWKLTKADHAKTAQHLKSLDLEEKDTCTSEGRKYQMHITLTAPADSPICCSINKMSESERIGMKMLFEAAYLTVKKRKTIFRLQRLDWMGKASGNKINSSLSKLHAMYRIHKVHKQSIVWWKYTQETWVSQFHCCFLWRKHQRCCHRERMHLYFVCRPW